MKGNGKSVVAGKKVRKTEKPSGSGSAAVAGYEYQIDVSVWLALELVVVARLTEEMTLEPASEEDLAGCRNSLHEGCSI